MTALMLAAENGHREVAVLLLQRGADVHTKGKVHYAVLMLGGLREKG